MTRATALLIIALLALAALAVSENAAPNSGLPVVKSGYPIEHRDIIPWTLNTRCMINSSNLPERNPKEIV